jgi:hypothetical protein
MTIEEALAWVDLCAGIPSPVITKMSDAEILVKCLGTQDVLSDEVRRLREALTEIAHHPHQSYDHPENGAAPYGTGCADGHRCAANIALAALKGEGR